MTKTVEIFYMIALKMQKCGQWSNVNKILSKAVISQTKAKNGCKSCLKEVQTQANIVSAFLSPKCPTSIFSFFNQERLFLRSFVFLKHNAILISLILLIFYHRRNIIEVGPGGGVGERALRSTWVYVGLGLRTLLSVWGVNPPILQVFRYIQRENWEFSIVANFDLGETSLR